MESREREERLIDVKELLLALKGRGVVIILSGIIFAAVMIIVTVYFVPPEYESTASVYIIARQQETQLNSSDMSVSTALTADAEVLITSRTVLEQVIEDVNGEETYAQLQERITVNNPTDTRILEVTATDRDPYRAKKIVDALADASVEHTTKLMGIEQVNIFEYGDVATKPASPNMLLNVVLGGVVGILISATAVVLLFIFDDTIRTEDDVETYFGVPVLGTIPNGKKKGASGEKVNLGRRAE